MSTIKNSGLDQHGTEPFKQQQFGRAGIERVKGLTATAFWLATTEVGSCKSLCVETSRLAVEECYRGWMRFQACKNIDSDP